MFWYNFRKYLELSQKYEVVIKEKMLVKLERDRLLIKAETLGKQLQQVNRYMQIEEKFTGGQGPSTDAQGGEKEKDSKRELSKKPGAKLTPIAKQERVNPHA